MNDNNSLVINDELHINLSDRSVMNIENKTLIKLRPKPFRVLLYLHYHNGHCISKDELFNECWNGAVVSDQSLTNTISTLRKALSTIGINSMKLTTVSKAGYLLENVTTEVPVDAINASSPEVSESKEYVEIEVLPSFNKEVDKELPTKNNEKLVYLKKLMMLMLAITSLSLIRGCYNTNNINKNMNQRLVSTENISYNLIDNTGILDLENIEGIIRLNSYKNCKARHIDITVTKEKDGVFETDFSIVYKNKAYNYLHSYKVVSDNSEVRIVQLSRILSLCKLSF
ncbi:winged helix-turn-helix domain-containing protein [Vibrio sp. J383]|uniref:winged helix-turn-helix domain-containing protein n=1 Tax=Vibrio sp. J383 TaxID=2942997 RepID=UPI0020C16119|nr:winged helix-turn-helix domain-containing protein [Vibrio sp. J383]UQV20513.1 winged helix-turn-helix domain-containing protein [Vibrio sp. J383]